MKRLDVTHIRSFFEKEGYMLLSDQYANNQTVLDYKCPKGHVNQTDWHHFQRGCRCPDCCGKKKRTITQIRTFLEERGYKLLSSQYISTHHKLKYECPNRHINEMCWYSFQHGCRCPECYGNKSPTIQQIRAVFDSEKYILLSAQYENARSRLKYECPEGHSGETTWDYFQRGHRCPECNEWVKEKELGTILSGLFPGQVKRQDNLDFLQQLRVDYSVRDLRLAFEYDGEHHFKPTTYGGMSKQQAKDCFVKQQERDHRKSRLCKENGYRLIRIAYDEDLSMENIRRKINENILFA